MKHFVHGLNKQQTRYIRAEVDAESCSDAMRKVRAANPDAGALACRPPNHKAAVLDALATRRTAERVPA